MNDEGSNSCWLPEPNFSTPVPDAPPTDFYVAEPPRGHPTIDVAEQGAIERLQGQIR